VREYILQLPAFEGPLDLLLHFVRTRDIDIRHLPIAPICKDYLEFLRACEEIDLTLSSEWLAMAARLIYIKSCTLLPGRGLDEAPGNESYWPDVEDPRAQLIRELMDRERLLAIRKAIPAFQVRESQSLGTYVRSVGSDLERDDSRSYDLGETGIYDLLDLYRRVLLRRERERPLEVNVKQLRLSEVIKELLSKWLPKGVTRFFRALLPTKFSIHEAVTTFLAILELARTGRVRLVQNDPMDRLSVERLH
jgi:segregation and condensation protein A